jgi:hypothetical protein
MPNPYLIGVIPALFLVRQVLTLGYPIGEMVAPKTSQQSLERNEKKLIELLGNRSKPQWSQAVDGLSEQ